MHTPKTSRSLSKPPTLRLPQTPPHTYSPHSPPPPIHSYHNHNHHNHHRLVPCPSVQPARYRPKIFGQPATVTSPEPPSSSSSTCCLLACLLNNPNRSSLGSCLRLVSAFTPCSIHVDSVRWTVSHLPPPPRALTTPHSPLSPSINVTEFPHSPSTAPDILGTSLWARNCLQTSRNYIHHLLTCTRGYPSQNSRRSSKCVLEDFGSNFSNQLARLTSPA